MNQENENEQQKQLIDRAAQQWVNLLMMNIRHQKSINKKKHLPIHKNKHE